jgi:uncharacterized protein with PIN domain
MAKQTVWNNTRRKLKLQFERDGITRCEQCGSGMFLGFAHRLKRRFIQDKYELMMVALLCVKCHEFWEHGSHERMFEGITAIIEKRNEQIKSYNY